MVFNHNDHYHPLLLRHVPPGARRALDVGCGTGLFAGRLAARGLVVDAVDPAREVIEAAPATEGVRFVHADITAMELPSGYYDVISCLASLHHVPFATVSRLREALAPGGVLMVLGCHRGSGWADPLVDLVAVPANAVARLAHGRHRPASPVEAPVRAPEMTLPEIRREAARLLPGARIRRLLFWRYLLTSVKD